MSEPGAPASQSPKQPPNQYPNRIAVSTESVAAYVADSIAVKQALLADTALHARIVELTERLLEGFRRGQRLFVAGNGGSAADAQHLAAELVARFEFDRPGIAAIALSTDTSALTAIGNDYGYEFLFSRQLEALARPGDFFLGITTSGNSKNIVKAMEVAPKLGVTRIALCGQGGRVQEMAEHVLAAPSRHTPRIQESHILIIHVLCALIEENLFPEFKAPKPPLP